MTIIEQHSLKDAYRQLVGELFSSSKVNGTHELENAIVIVHNPSTKDLEFPYRKVSQTYTNAELEWYWSADNRCATIGKSAKMWLRITDDGITNNSAYGYIIFKKYGFNQLEQIIDLLSKDNYSRRAVLNISDPAINRITTKDMQCTIALQFLIRNGELHETVYMRSNDVYFGFPYDYTFFVSIGEYISRRLGIPLTLYTHNATSLHMYDRDLEKFNANVTTKLDVNVEEVIDRLYRK